MAGLDVANKVHAALQRAGSVFGDGDFSSTLRRPTYVPATPWDAGTDTTTDFEVIGASISKEEFDRTGRFLGVREILMLSPNTARPAKGDLIAVGVALADVTSGTEFATIAEVRPFEPLGTVLYYELDLES